MPWYWNGNLYFLYIFLEKLESNIHSKSLYIPNIIWNLTWKNSAGEETCKIVMWFLLATNQIRLYKPFSVQYVLQWVPYLLSEALHILLFNQGNVRLVSPQIFSNEDFVMCSAHWCNSGCIQIDPQKCEELIHLSKVFLITHTICHNLCCLVCMTYPFITRYFSIFFAMT